MDAITPLPLRVVTAGAGTGKTHRITSDIMGAVVEGLSAESVLATTFTIRAAAELQERVQAALAKAGHRAASVQLPDALIGTVNAVCGRLLTEFAFEAGLPPNLAVLDEAAAEAAFEAAVSAMVAEYEEVIGPVVKRLGYAGGGEYSPYWVDSVREIALAARYNRLKPSDVMACLPRALAGVMALLSPPDPAGEDELDAALSAAMSALLTRSQEWNTAGEFGVTLKAIARVRQASRDFDPAHGRFLPWSEWAALSKLAPAVGRRADFADVVEAASAHDRHPQLHKDIRTLVRTCYAAASRALESYAAYKMREGLLDFCDQETLLLNLLEGNAAVRDELAARLRLVFVDEFQDTSRCN